MTPNYLHVNRLIIITDEGLVAYDEKFHNGVNIIRGQNSSGKSTITHFIFYVLGGDFVDFVPEAKLCSNVYAEVNLNGAVLSIRRELVKDENENEKIKRQSPMYVFWGVLESALAAGPETGWQRFGYKSLQNQKSFSNVLFDNLDLPIVKGENNITIHQVLRLLYIDQDSPTNSLFYFEQFDSQLTRETVADLLLGVYNEELYENRKRLLEAEREMDDLKAEIRATKQFFKDPLILDAGHVRTMIDEKSKQVDEINQEVVNLRRDGNEGVSGVRLQFQSLNDEAIIQRKELVQRQNDLEQLKNEIYDSEFFLETMLSKLTALRNSIETRDFLGGLPLDYCPECLTRLTVAQSNGTCKLCKESIDGSFGVVQARRMEQEIGFQISESTKILEIHKRELIEKESAYSAEEEGLQQIQRQVDAALANVRTRNQEKLDQLLERKGFFDGELLQFRNFLEQAEFYGKLQNRQDELRREIEYLRGFVNRVTRQQESLKESVNSQIKTEGTFLLNNDLDRQDDFKNAHEFFIDFANNIAYLSNRYSKYSASSNFYLKVSARFALFFASLRIKDMRYPRFLFADNMEDKGIEKERAQNLQRIIIKHLAAYPDNSYQLIYTTSYITEELNNSSLVVGDFYAKENPSLMNIKYK